MLLRDVNWTVRENENWVIVGPNGAGKTTLLQLAGGLIEPSSGRAEVLGEPLDAADDLNELRSRVGVASAAVADQVPRAEKVIDLVMTAGYGTLGRTAEEFDSFDVARAVELLDAVGCAHLIRRRFGTLSEGERKRVQIARSLMADPELLLLDEPAAGLDLGGREDLMLRLAALVRDPRSPILVLVTHHVEEVPAGFTHAMLMRSGAVLTAGPIAEVFTERNLSRCFGVPLIVEHHASRWTARAVPVRLCGLPLVLLSDLVPG
jgi:iron complex transport system ATP-binding protein